MKGVLANPISEPIERKDSYGLTLDVVLERCSCNEHHGCSREPTESLIELTLRILEAMRLVERA